MAGVFVFPLSDQGFDFLTLGDDWRNVFGAGQQHLLGEFSPRAGEPSFLTEKFRPYLARIEFEQRV